MKAFLQFNFFHGLHHAETGVRIYDYVDSNIPILDEMSEKRKTDYKSLGNTMINSKLLPCSLPQKFLIDTSRAGIKVKQPTRSSCIADFNQANCPEEPPVNLPESIFAIFSWHVNNIISAQLIPQQTPERQMFCVFNNGTTNYRYCGQLFWGLFVITTLELRSHYKLRTQGVVHFGLVFVFS